MRLHEADDDRPRGERVDFGERRGLNLEQHGGCGEHGRRTGVEAHPLEQLVSEMAALAGPALHVEGHAELEKLGRDIGGQGDPCLVGKGLLQHTDTEWHPTAPCS